jgi:hypothetical protein
MPPPFSVRPTFGSRTCAGRRPRRELREDLVDLGDTGGANGVTLGDQPAARVHGNWAVEVCGLRVDQLAAFARAAEAKLFIEDQLRGSRCVVHFADVQVLGTDAGHLVRSFYDCLGDTRFAGGAVEAGAEDGGAYVNGLRRELLSLLGRDQDRRRCAIANRVST